MTAREQPPEIKLILGDNLEVMRGLPSESIDAIVTDPPAGVGFMGVAWDTYNGKSGAARSEADWDWTGSKERPRTSDQAQRVTAKQGRNFRAFITPVFEEMLRLVKPGGHALVWALPRTSHWTATALEDAGWLIEDRVAHCFGSGFPKHKSKLKPAVEDWWLCTKPGGKKWLNIDACRIPAPEGLTSGGQCQPKTRTTYAQDEWTQNWDKPRSEEHPLGRWPTNLAFSHHPECVRAGTKQTKSDGHFPKARTPRTESRAIYGDGYGLPVETGGGESYMGGVDGLEIVAAWECVPGCPVSELDRQSGELKSGTAVQRNGGGQSIGTGRCYSGSDPGLVRPDATYADSGGASRFFPTFAFETDDFAPFLYEAKAGRADRNLGCESLPKQRSTDDDWVSESRKDAPSGGKTSPQGNHHPTVKSTSLMRWLCRLITPPSGTILDPFLGSGSTLKAAMLEGFGGIGIEVDPTYFAIAQARVKVVELPLFPNIAETNP